MPPDPTSPPTTLRLPEAPGAQGTPSASLELARRNQTNEVDPELLALPDPPKRQRAFTVAILSLGTIASVAMIFAVRHDLAYATQRGTAANLGDLRTTPSAQLEASANTFISADALLGAAGALRYERPLCSDTFRLLPVAGRTDLWVEVRVPAGQENGRWEPPHAFIGRLQPFATVGPRHRGLAAAITAATEAPLPPNAYLLVDGEDPAHARWSILVALLFLGFAAGNTAAIARLRKKIR